MTDSEKLKAITDALLGIVSIINKQEDITPEVKVEKVKKKSGRPKKNKVVDVEAIDESLDVHRIVQKPNKKNEQKGSLIQMEIRTEPMKFIDTGAPPDKIDKKLTYIKASRTKRKKPYEATLVECKCNVCGKTYKLDAIFAPRKYDSTDEGGLFTCDKCIKRKGF